MSSETANIRQIRNTVSPIEIARLYKFYLQKHPLNRACIFRRLDQIQAKNLYLRYKKIFDRFAYVCEKIGIDANNFLYYAIVIENKCVITDIICKKTIKQYAIWKKTRKQYEQIADNFVASAENIANDCIKNGYTSCVPYIKEIISRGLLGDEYLAGKISSYYLASINRFKDIYCKLDDTTKQTLSGVYFMSEKYKADLQDAFLSVRNMRVSPVTFTNDLIKKKIEGET